MDYQNIAPIIGLVKDVALTLGALTTMALGVYGVRIWKRDLVGKEVYSVIGTVVKQLHKVSKAALKLRDPVQSYEHRNLSRDESIHLTENERWRLLEREVYVGRLDKLALAIETLDESLLSARVLVGSSVYASTLEFRARVNQCIERLNDYLDLLNDNLLSLGEDSPQIASAQQALYPAKELDDDLTEHLVNARETAEIALLRYLHRSNIRGDVLTKTQTTSALITWKKIRQPSKTRAWSE